MTLSARLLASHTTPLVVVLVALGFVLASLGRVTQIIGDLEQNELRTLVREGALHQAAWNLDLAMRRVGARCASPVSAAAAARDVETRTAALARQLAETQRASSALLDASRAYVELARRLLAEGVCSSAYASAERERAELDATMTTVWVERLAELHEAAREQDERARRLGASALWAGVAVSLVGIVLAFAAARRLATQIGEPLANIARVARRLARGDFDEPLSSEGPQEIAHLATELERMRVRLAELDTLKQGFLASVSHEMRTPLSKIREALALLSDGACGKLDPAQQRVVAIARTACEREIRLVTTLLDLSRLQAGAPLRLRGGASLDGALDRAVEDETADAQARGVTIELRREGEIPATRLDEALVERAFANLIRNAVSVSSAGQRVTVERTLVERDGRRGVAVTVRDQGPGVPAAVRESIFEPFVTMRVVDSPKSVGVGLGLALAREVARAHGGDVHVEDDAGRGARFVFWIPLDTRPSAPPDAQASALVGREASA